MEKTLLLSVEDWQTWYNKEVSAWGSRARVQSWGDTETPNEYPCILIACDSSDEYAYGNTIYDFIYKSDVEKLFQ
jgi:hypothetical protein